MLDAQRTQVGFSFQLNSKEVHSIVFANLQSTGVHHPIVRSSCFQVDSHRLLAFAQRPHVKFVQIDDCLDVPKFSFELNNV